MKMLVSKMPLVIGEFYETVLKPMALEKGGITAMTIVNGSGDIIDLDRMQVFALDYLKKQPFELAGYKAMPEDVQKLYDLSVKYAL